MLNIILINEIYIALKFITFLLNLTVQFDK